MAPMKRHRSILDDGDTEILDSESALSSLQQASRKKARLSYHDVEISSSNEASDDESFVEQATQFATQQRSKTPRPNQPADNGIIESVTCSNFMCHSHLETKLGPLINFIIGHNGSGKSAVLTAITICLGGKASSTNRGQSLKSFIKEGQESAMLSVKIKNTGESAYQHDVFGDVINVERHFSRSGSSAFKLKNSNGRLISNKKSDLDEMCDYFALQIDNPMNVLTQDMARQFLNNSSPSEKYKFFMKGTQLEHLDGDYLIVEQTLDIIDTELHKKTQDYEVFDTQAQEAQELLQLSEQQDLLHEKIDLLTHQMAWIQVEHQEQSLHEKDLELRWLDEEILRLEAEANSHSESFAQTEQAVVRADQALMTSKETLRPLQEQKSLVKEEFDKCRTELSSLQTEQRSIAEEIKTAKGRLSTIKSEIEDEHQRLSEADGGRNLERRLELEKKQEAATQAKARHREHDDELPVLQDHVKRAETERKDSVELLRIKRQNVRQAEERLEGMKRSRGRQLNAYVDSMPRLLEAVSQDRSFQHKPVGPIGNHVRLLNPSWSSILEKQFGGALDSFIVTCKEDQSRLSALMQRCSCNCPILIGNNNRLDTSSHEPALDLETWMRVLEIDNDLVRNSLIINQGIDQTILIADREEALATMNGDRLLNVKQCFTHNKRGGQGIRFGYGFGGGLSESFIPAFSGTPRMKTDIEYQIRSQESIVQDLKAEQHSIEKSNQQKQAYLVECEQAVGKHKKVSKDKMIEAQQAQSLVEDLQDALDRDAVEEGRLDALKGQLDEEKEGIEVAENSYQEAVVAKDTLNESLKEGRDKMAELDNQIKEAEAHVLKAESKATQCSTKRAGALRDKNAAIESVERAQRKREGLLKDRQQQDEVVIDFIHQAENVSSRVAIDPGDTSKALENRHAKLERDLKHSRDRVGDRAEIARKACKAFEVRDRAKEEIEKTETLAQLLKTTLIHRKERWKRFQTLITARARIQFFYLLSERGFRGKLLANRREKTMDLIVEPDETRKSGRGRTTHGLSGGEKSFSTICLLLSIWEAMGAPIRCLDEFDVFMDNINREISMGMMIAFARNSPGKQFVLISPQSATNVNYHESDVKVIRMTDPRRGGQQELSFAAA